MPSFDNQKIMREIIVDHYDNPRNKSNKSNDESYNSCNLKSPSCIDNITAFVKVENGIIKDIKFDGIACAISTSSTDIMIDNLINKSIEDAKKIIRNYLAMINGQKYDESLLGELFVFQNVHKQLNRVKCAKVGIQAIAKALKIEDEE